MNGPDQISLKLALALRRPTCSVFRAAGQKWETPNSSVASVPGLGFPALKAACDPRNFTVSIVRVSGPTPEPLHYHISHIVGLVVSGRGELRYESEDGSESTFEANEGDLVVIPKGAYHVFETKCGSPMEYIAFEFSEAELDYQAHWKSEAYGRSDT